MAVDPSFKPNNYNKPKLLTEKQTYINNILMLLFGEPGFYPSIPELGMNIKQYLYMFEDEIDTEEIKATLAEQCDDFSEDIDEGNLEVLVTVYNERTALVFILPVLDDTSEKNVVLGITTNAHGEIIYNFVENKYQMI